MIKTLVILLFLQSMIFANDVLIKLKDGNIIQGDYIGTLNGSIYCQLPIWGEIKIIPCNDILEIRDNANKIINIDCSENTYDPKVKKSTYHESSVEDTLIEIILPPSTSIMKAGEYLEEFTMMFYFGLGVTILGGTIISSSDSMYGIKIGFITTTLGSIIQIVSFNKIKKAGEELKKASSSLFLQNPNQNMEHPESTKK